ncbi:unnamed protein product [Penicillium nalgiovense]|nr:hypothetical protein PENNAL_c0062G07735 [Penicillium nalgiovense]CAG7965270.1 unnamed protein product [Penicillium nalgiovense]CAG8039945.1 unnamed protein product [Penicillium nalgiovense]CAG8085145.1 unnamed protein product [Penicillium nalgiovense]CAG8103206.1 unnamed protein product [Penicillium nalgiovense]
MNSESTMKIRKQVPPRKKACQSCTDSKVRCGLEKPTCSRCRARGKQCRYPAGSGDVYQSSPVVSNGQISADEILSFEPSLANFSTTPTLTAFSSPVSGHASDIPRIDSQHESTQTVDTDLTFDHIDLVPMIDAEKIRDRWLQPYLLTATEQVPKLFNPFTVQFVTCVLRSYPNHLLDEKGLPPFIHPLQLNSKAMPRTIANCFSLVRMWMNRVAGSEAIVLSTVRQEMERLSREGATSDFETLCSFQVYLIYLLTAYFFPIGNASLIDDMSMITLQDFAFRVAKAGFTCKAELSQTRPTWESWIIASAKRRTLFTMYIFSNVYNSDKGLPNFLSDELGGILVPESKALWEASDRDSWTRQYNRHLSKWEDGMLQISELWRSPETGSEARRKRIGRWVQSTDEFGMMLFAVCAHIHGC